MTAVKILIINVVFFFCLGPANPVAGDAKTAAIGYFDSEGNSGLEFSAPTREPLFPGRKMLLADPVRERELVVLINQYRRANSLLPYKMDSLLTNAARGHSTDMAVNNFFSHTGSGGTTPGQRITAAGYNWTTYGETIAAGNSTAAATINQWKGSPPHNAIMLSSSYREIGIGYAYSASSTYGHYWTADYGARSGVYPLVINDEEETTSSRNVTLYVHAPAGATQMRFQNSGGSWTGWEPYQATKSWTLTSGNGSKTVSSEVKSGASTYSASDDIVLQESGRYVIASGDYNGDGYDDIAVFRRAAGLWAVRGVTRVYFGSSSDIPVPGDYDGNLKTEIGVFRAASGLWAIRGTTRVYFGSSSDIPVPGDYNGNGYCDQGIFRPGTGLWAVRGVTRVYYGTSSDQPVPGDYNGDNRCEIAVFRSVGGRWAVKGITRVYFGGANDIPVPGDYTATGAAHTRRPGIFRPSSGLWAIRGITRCYFGGSPDQPVPADYHDGWQDEMGIFRETAGLWAIRGVTRVYFGSAGDIPVTR
ncbi:MAG: CAP domain-containing protein [PVC group bacterium]